MIVERYLEWAESAPAPVRAEAAGALARSYLYGELDPAVRADIEFALIRSLDDPSVGVRSAIAEAFAGSADAPPVVVLALASDAPEVAEQMLSRSPLLADVELVDLLAQGGLRTQVAIARRISVSAPLCAAIVEVGRVEACAALVENPGARLTRSVVARLAERHGADAAVRGALLKRMEVGSDLRQILMRSVATSLQSFVTGCGWLTPERARRAAEEACERGALSIAAAEPDAHDFVRHLIGRGEFSPGLALRALLCGKVAVFEAALSTLSGQAPERVASFVRDFEGRGFEALYRCAGFPMSALPVYRAALGAAREFGFSGANGADAELSRRMVERALTACEGADVDVAALRALLRRFATEAARGVARRSRSAPAVEAARAA